MNVDIERFPHKYRLMHFPNVPCKPFIAYSDDLAELIRMREVLAQQHLFLFDNKFIPDYANSILLEERIPEEVFDPENDKKDDPYWNLDDYEVEELLGKTVEDIEASVVTNYKQPVDPESLNLDDDHDDDPASGKRFGDVKNQEKRTMDSSELRS